MKLSSLSLSACLLPLGGISQSADCCLVDVSNVAAKAYVLPSLTFSPGAGSAWVGAGSAWVEANFSPGAGSGFFALNANDLDSGVQVQNNF